MMDLLTDIRFIIAVIICMCVIAVVLGICLYLRYRRDNEASPIGGGLSVEIGNAQIIGTREKQDDSFATSIMPYGVMAIVADGIGGYINGNLASKIAVETYLDEFERRNATDNISYYFQTSAVLSNSRIRDEFGEARGGTTAVVVVLTEGKMYWTSVMETVIRCDQEIKRLIEINRKENVKNWLEDQYLAGAINKEAAMGGPMDKRLVNYLGYDGFKKASESDRPILLRKKDQILIYSDGVEVIGQIELENIMSRKGTAQAKAEMIMEAIENKRVNSKDNSTIIILEVK